MSADVPGMGHLGAFRSLRESSKPHERQR
jgi:hypothetical protein